MSAQSNEITLFLRRWLANPLRVGSVVPSSRALAALVARNAVHTGDEVVVELGAGTGTITKGLIKRGLPEERLILVELDPDMLSYLRVRFPKATVIADDASRPDAILPEEVKGRVDTVISGIPALQFSLEKQRDYLDRCLAVMREGGQVLQYTYSLKSPLRHKELGLHGQRLGVAFANLPPAHLWTYKDAEAVAAASAAE